MLPTASPTTSTQNTGLGQVDDADGREAAVYEFAASGTPVGITALAVDPDGDPVTYSLADDAGGRFVIDPVTGVVTVGSGALLNYDEAQGHEILIGATDGAYSVLTPMYISVVPDREPFFNFPPEPPKDRDPALNYVAEGAATGTPVGLTAFSTDPDVMEYVTYSLSDDAGGRFAINEWTGVVTVADGSLLDHETASSHEITVRATGNFWPAKYTDRTFSIAVTAGGPPPDDGVDEPVELVFDNDAAENAISEYGYGGDTVGITALGVDPDGAPLTYSLANAGEVPFVIDPVTGVVTVAPGATLDYETAESYELMVQASDGASTVQAPMTVTILNELYDGGNPPKAPVDRDPAKNYVAEGAATGTPVGLTAFSADPEVMDYYTYSLSDDAGGRFAIDPYTGVVTVADGSLIDYETAGSHTIRVVTTEYGDPGRHSAQTFTIAVTQGGPPPDDGVNEAPGPVFDVDPAYNYIPDYMTGGDPVGITALSIDPDGDAVTYSLANAGAVPFAIDPITGVVTVAPGAVLDVDADQSYELVLQASDGVHTVQAPVTLDVFSENWGNYNPPVPATDSDAADNAVAEGAASGTPVGLTAFSTDPDAFATLIYSLTDDAGGRFAIDGSTGVVTVADGSLLDYETATSHTITVRASEDGFWARHTDQTFTIAVLDVADTPPAGGGDGEEPGEHGNGRKKGHDKDKPWGQSPDHPKKNGAEFLLSSGGLSAEESLGWLGTGGSGLEGAVTFIH